MRPFISRWGPDHTGRAMRRVFRKGFAQKVARTSVLKHYGLKTLLYGVLLPGPDIGRCAGDAMRGVHDAGLEVGLHSFDNVRWQDHVAEATPAWTRTEFERGLEAFERVFGFAPPSHAAAGWQINDAALGLEQEYGCAMPATPAGAGRSCRCWDGTPVPAASCPPRCPPSMNSSGSTASTNRALPMPCFSGRRPRPKSRCRPLAGVHPARGTRRHAAAPCLRVPAPEVAGGGAVPTRMAEIHRLALQGPLPARAVVMGEVAGRSGRLAVQAVGGAAST